MMIDGPNSIHSCDGGDPPCWSHLLEDVRGDIVDRDDIERLVRDFYRDAAMDDLLGPVFEAAHVNWNAHVATLTDFWSWQLLGEVGYEGQPLRAHEPVHARTPLTSSHYARWVELFCDTVDASFEGPRAEVAKGRGRKMAAAMERLLAGVSASGAAPIEPMWRRADGS
jgi:hemoglobin